MVSLIDHEHAPRFVRAAGGGGVLLGDDGYDSKGDRKAPLLGSSNTVRAEGCTRGRGNELAAKLSFCRKTREIAPCTMNGGPRRDVIVSGGDAFIRAIRCDDVVERITRAVQVRDGQALQI